MQTMNASGLDLKLRRIALDVKAKDLAAALGRTSAYVSRIEARRVVAPEVADEYLSALAAFGAVTTSQPVAEPA